MWKAAIIVNLCRLQRPASPGLRPSDRLSGDINRARRSMCAAQIVHYARENACNAYTLDALDQGDRKVAIHQPIVIRVCPHCFCRTDQGTRCAVDRRLRISASADQFVRPRVAGCIVDSWDPRDGDPLPAERILVDVPVRAPMQPSHARSPAPPAALPAHQQTPREGERCCCSSPSW